MFPSGFVEYGEHPAEALVREFLEETGLSISQFEIVGIFQSEDDPREPGHFIILYQIGGWSGELRNDPNENDGVAWFELGDLPEVSLRLHCGFLSKRTSRRQR